MSTFVAGGALTLLDISESLRRLVEIEEQRGDAALIAGWAAPMPPAPGLGDIRRDPLGLVPKTPLPLSLSE